MNTEIKEKWLKALRSGEYIQTTGILKDDRGYCCLGVLCDLYRKDKNIQGFDNEKGIFIDLFENKSNEILTDDVMLWAGLDNRDPAVSLGLKEFFSNTLSNLNDNGESFNEIADLIEQNL